MGADETAPKFRRLTAAAESADTRSELERLRRTCRRQTRVIDALGEAVARLRHGVAALKADNAELRAENARLRRERGGRGRDGDVDGRRAPAARAEGARPSADGDGADGDGAAPIADSDGSSHARRVEEIVRREMRRRDAR